MGTSMSMDISASCPNVNGVVNGAVDHSSSSPLLLPMLTPTPMLHEPKSFEDNWRTESILIPEDITDIHIEAAASSVHSITEDADASSTIPSSDIPTDNRRCGKGKQRRRNGKGKQNAQADTTVPVQIERTIEQRREQVRPIIDKLTELQMNISYPAIRELYKQLNHFVKTGEDSKIKISFPEFSRKIKGELTNAVYKPCWVKLEME
jgi:hypothetical protein